MHVRFALGALGIALLCAAPLGAAELRLTDDSGHEVVLPRAAERIVSLAPHLTEVLFAAGAGDKVVGVVNYSDYPEAATRLPQVGSFNNVDLEAVARLRPDLVLAWSSGNRAVNLDKLRALGIPLFISEVRKLDDVAHSLETVGRLAGTEDTAKAAADAFRARRDALAARYRARPPVRMFYQIWDRPLMTINGEHLISDAIRLCGGENVFAGLPQLAPTIGVEAVLAANPEAVVASGMGEARPDWLDQWKNWSGLSAAQADNLYFIPPQLIQRHTPRLLDGAEQLCGFLEQARAKRTAAPR